MTRTGFEPVTPAWEADGLDHLPNEPYITFVYRREWPTPPGLTTVQFKVLTGMAANYKGLNDPCGIRTHDFTVKGWWLYTTCRRGQSMLKKKVCIIYRVIFIIYFFALNFAIEWVPIKLCHRFLLLSLSYIYIISNFFQKINSQFFCVSTEGGIRTHKILILSQARMPIPSLRHTNGAWGLRSPYSTLQGSCVPDYTKAPIYYF